MQPNQQSFSILIPHSSPPFLFSNSPYHWFLFEQYVTIAPLLTNPLEELVLKINKLASILISITFGFLLCVILFIPSAHAGHIPSKKFHPTKISHGTSIRPQVLKEAVNAYLWALAHNEVKNPNILTVVDFSRPSYEKRLWVINLKTGKVLMHLHVAQGRNSGAVYATRFSNHHGTHESCPGIFTTENVYNGEHGASLRVNGLERGINNNALSRAIVIHPASYVTPSFIKHNGYAGRSWGCFAVNPAHVLKFIDTIKNGSVFFVYAAPENHDSLVDHSLTANGEKLFQALESRLG